MTFSFRLGLISFALFSKIFGNFFLHRPLSELKADHESENEANEKMIQSLEKSNLLLKSELEKNKAEKIESFQNFQKVINEKIELKNDLVLTLEKVNVDTKSELERMKNDCQSKVALKNNQIQDLEKSNLEAKNKIKVLELELRDEKMFTEVNQDLNVKYENLNAR